AAANAPTKSVGPAPEPLFARDCFNPPGTAEWAQRFIARLVGQQSRGNVSLDQKIEMRLHFFRHLGVPSVFLKQPEQSREPGAKSRHILLPSGQHEIDSFGDAEPMLLFRGELFATGRGQ